MTDEFFNILNNDESQKEKDLLIGKYRHVFDSTFGIDVLEDILIRMCHMGSFLSNADEVAQHNLGVNILLTMGIYSIKNMKNVVRALAAILPTLKED